MRKRRQAAALRELLFEQHYGLLIQPQGMAPNPLFPLAMVGRARRARRRVPGDYRCGRLGEPALPRRFAVKLATFHVVNPFVPAQCGKKRVHSSSDECLERAVYHSLSTRIHKYYDVWG